MVRNWARGLPILGKLLSHMGQAAFSHGARFLLRVLPLLGIFFVHYQYKPKTVIRTFYFIFL